MYIISLAEITHAPMPTSTHTHPLNTQHHLLVLKSAGVFPHGASKRQRLRDQRLLWLCSSARLLSTLMQMCARQSGSEGRQACMQCLGKDWPSNYPYLWKPALSLLCSIWLSSSLSLSYSQYSPSLSATHSSVYFSLTQVLYWRAQMQKSINRLAVSIILVFCLILFCFPMWEWSDTILCAFDLWWLDTSLCFS